MYIALVRTISWLISICTCMALSCLSSLIKISIKLQCSYIFTWNSFKLHEYVKSIKLWAIKFISQFFRRTGIYYILCNCNLSEIHFDGKRRPSKIFSLDVNVTVCFTQLHVGCYTVIISSERLANLLKLQCKILRF